MTILRSAASSSFIIVLAGLSVAAAVDLERQPGFVRSEPLFENPPFLECHASTIVETPSGLVTAWFGGTKEGNPDVGIWVSRLSDGRWTPPTEVANGAEHDDPRVNCLNPVLFRAPDGRLMLYYKTGKWWAYYKSSTDDGANWSRATRLPNGFFGPVKNKPVTLADGRIISPTSSELRGAGWRVHFEVGTDGMNWSYVGPVNDGNRIGAIQPSILLHPGNKLQALGRTSQGKLFEVWSDDGGKSWGELTLSSLPNPNSGTDAVTLADGRHLLVYNHSGLNPPRKGKTNGYRSPLNVAVSNDGRNWHAALVLEDEPFREFSYPAVIQTADGLVHITYTQRRQVIQHVIVDPSRLALRPIVDGVWPD
jgi:alpha-L-rhamnosidase